MLPRMNGDGLIYLCHMWKVPVYVSWTAIFLLMFGYRQAAGDPYWCQSGTDVAVALSALVLTVLLHELGHALVARLFRLEQVTITLAALGGFCSYQGQPTPWQKLFVSSAGPLMNFALAGASYGLGRSGIFTEHITEVLLFSMLWWNLLLGIFNSLPLYPLDGGQCTYALARAFCQRGTTAKAITFWVSVVTAFAASAWMLMSPRFGHSIYNIILIAYLLYQAYTDLW
jgi:Zn-dependent protease